jgi:glycosyltransferase involved in cell wall biosynthesis
VCSSDLRDIWPQTLIDIGGYSKFNPLVLLLGWFEKFGYNHADHIVATMPRADLHIRKRIKKDFNYSCIPQGIDLKLMNQSISLTEQENKMYFPKERFVVGYAGALGISNSLDTIIKAANILDKGHYDNIHFMLVGDGNAKESLMDLAKDLKNVSFVSKIPKNKVQSFLHRCSVLHDSVKPVPIYDYGLSRNKWMDYMFSGRPLIVSFSGFDNLISEAHCGTVVPAGDPVKLAEAIVYYYHMDKDQLERIGQNGKDYLMQQRTFKILAASYHKIFLSFE